MMIKNVLMMISLMGLIASCVRQYHFCDDHTGVCYECDGVGCATAVYPNADSSIPTNLITTDATPPTIDTGVPIVVDGGLNTCYSNITCSVYSICVEGNCRVSCREILDCHRVDYNYGACSPQGYCIF